MPAVRCDFRTNNSSSLGTFSGERGDVAKEGGVGWQGRGHVPDLPDIIISITSIK